MDDYIVCVYISSYINPVLLRCTPFITSALFFYHLDTQLRFTDIYRQRHHNSINYTVICFVTQMERHYNILYDSHMTACYQISLKCKHSLQVLEYYLSQLQTWQQIALFICKIARGWQNRWQTGKTTCQKSLRVANTVAYINTPL